MSRTRFIAGVKGARLPAPVIGAQVDPPESGTVPGFPFQFGTGTGRKPLAKLVDYWWRVKTWNYQLELTRSPTGSVVRSGVLEQIPIEGGLPAVEGERARLRRAGWRLLLPLGGEPGSFVFVGTFFLFNGAADSSKIFPDGTTSTNYDVALKFDVTTAWEYFDPEPLTTQEIVQFSLDPIEASETALTGVGNPYAGFLRIGDDIEFPLKYAATYQQGPITRPVDPDLVSWYLSLRLTPAEWFTYADSEGANPIYDGTTGAQLITPFQPGDPG